jgi:hypothetical protein
MRNDARPIGEHSPASPLGGDLEPAGSEIPSDSRDSHKPDRQSHIVHPRAEDVVGRDDHDDTDPTMPTEDSTLNTKI